MSKLIYEYDPTKLLPADFIDRRYPNYNHEPLKFRKGKHWKPCSSELVKLKRKVDKLSAEYTQRQALGQTVRAKRIFKKAMALTDRISVLLGFDGKAAVNKGGKANEKQVAAIQVEADAEAKG